MPPPKLPNSSYSLFLNVSVASSVTVSPTDRCPRYRLVLVKAIFYSSVTRIITNMIQAYYTLQFSAEILMCQILATSR